MSNQPSNYNNRNITIINNIFPLHKQNNKKKYLHLNINNIY